MISSHKVCGFRVSLWPSHVKFRVNNDPKLLHVIQKFHLLIMSRKFVSIFPLRNINYVMGVINMNPHSSIFSELKYLRNLCPIVRRQT